MKPALILDCQKVSFAYSKKIHALKDISLQVFAGEIVALIGANGAGKSTFLKTVSGLLKPDHGRIFYLARQIDRLPAYKIARLGIAHVPEGRHIFAKLTVLENLQMGAFTITNGTQQLLEEMFSLFPRLRDRQNQLGGTLSGGEQQMLAMARALMMRPQLLMLDEPSMGLAPLMVEKIFETLKKISAQGITILLVEQNARQSLALAQRGYVLETGHIILTGSGADLLHNAQVQQAYLGIGQ